MCDHELGILFFVRNPDKHIKLKPVIQQENETGRKLQDVLGMYVDHNNIKRWIVRTESTGKWDSKNTCT